MLNLVLRVVGQKKDTCNCVSHFMATFSWGLGQKGGCCCFPFYQIFYLVRMGM